MAGLPLVAERGNYQFPARQSAVIVSERSRGAFACRPGCATADFVRQLFAVIRRCLVVAVWGPPPQYSPHRANLPNGNMCGAFVPFDALRRAKAAGTFDACASRPHEIDVANIPAICGGVRGLRRKRRAKAAAPFAVVPKGTPDAPYDFHVCKYSDVFKDWGALRSPPSGKAAPPSPQKKKTTREKFWSLKKILEPKKN